VISGQKPVDRLPDAFGPACPLNQLFPLALPPIVRPTSLHLYLHLEKFSERSLVNF
jgi:hypothetical protein